MNRYHFKCLFADGSRGMRNTTQKTYNDALNAVYFPGPELSHLRVVDEIIAYFDRDMPANSAAQMREKIQVLRDFSLV